MEALTDWFGLWSELSELHSRALEAKNADGGGDHWKDRARQFDREVGERWAKPDSSRDFLIGKLRGNPGSTLLDIGAGTGKWSVLAAPYASRVTALEPSAAMREVLLEKTDWEDIANIDVVDGSWPESNPGPHDFLLASHSMYGARDLKTFVEAMHRTARKGCIMVLRAPYAGAVMAEAARKVLGQPYDSPNFQIAYNALLCMDIFPDVVMEQEGNWPPWTHDSLDEAFEELRHRLGLPRSSEHAPYLWQLLEQNLRRENGRLVWPPGVRSALVYWDTSDENTQGGARS